MPPLLHHHVPEGLLGCLAAALEYISILAAVDKEAVSHDGVSVADCVIFGLTPCFFSSVRATACREKKEDGETAFVLKTKLSSGRDSGKTLDCAVEVFVF